MICGSGGSKSRLAKAAGAEPAGQMRDEKVHAVVARSTFPSQNVKNTRGSDHFWKLRCRKSARRCGANHISKSKCTKHTRYGPLLAVEMLKKCTPVARNTFGSQNVKNTRGSDHFWKFRCRKSARRCGTKQSQKCKKTEGHGALLDVQKWQAQEIVHLVENEQKSCSSFKNDGRRGAFEEDLLRFIFRGRRSTRDIFIGAVRRSGR